MKPLVSVVIPAYNAEEYVDDLIKNFEAQTYDQWELIIVDDQSEDDTFLLLQKYAETDVRIKVFVRDRLPKGSLTCRNIGVDRAKGKYIITLDADDIIKPFLLEQRMYFMERHPEVDYATFKGESVVQDANGISKKTGEYGIASREGMLERFLAGRNYPFSLWNNIYKAEVMKNIKFDENVLIYTDFSYIVPIILAGYKHAFCEDCKVDYLYCQGQGVRMTSNFIKADKYESTKYLFKKTMDSLKNHEKYEIYRKCFFKFYLLQFERVLISGSYEQACDFKKFIVDEYGSQYGFRLNLAWNIWKCMVAKGDKYTQKKVRLIIYLLFSPIEIFLWVYRKIYKRITGGSYE